MGDYDVKATEYVIREVGLSDYAPPIVSFIETVPAVK